MELDTQPAKDAIDALFGNTDVSPEETLEAMQDILDHVETCISALKDDLKRKS